MPRATRYGHPNASAGLGEWSVEIPNKIVDDHCWLTCIAKTSLTDADLRKVLTYVDTNLSDPIKNAALARVVALSTSHFSRTFKDTTGMTPRHYVRLRRVRAAQILMCHSAEKLSAIAVLCGLSDQSHLSKMFRQLVGESPSRWREHQRRALLSGTESAHAAVSSGGLSRSVAAAAPSRALRRNLFPNA